MKVSEAQQRALDTMREDPEGKVHAFHGVVRSTAEALERKGLVTVTRRMGEREIRRRGGGVTRRAYVDWTAQLKPVMPTDEQVAALDAKVEALDTASLAAGQHEQAAAYSALVSPQVALTGSPAASPDYIPAVAYAQSLREDPKLTMARFSLVRTMLGAVPTPPDPAELTGKPTNTWLITTPGTPQQAGTELARIFAATLIDARLTANSILNRRGWYDMRRLGTKEIASGWVKDFRAGGMVLRLSATPDGRAYQVTPVGSDDVIVIRPTVGEAEVDARTDIVSLTAALASRPAIPAEQT